jgi:GTP 3',8-cyclase
MSDRKVHPDKIVYHPERIAEYKRNGDIFPMQLDLSVVNYCNHACTKCNAFTQRETLDGINIRTDPLLKAARQMRDAGLKSVVIAGTGEPTLHKDIGPIVRGFRELGVDVGMSSNAQILTAEKIQSIVESVTWFRVSFDGATAATYEKLHGKSANFAQSLGNIEALVEAKRAMDGKSPLTIGVQMVVMEENAHEMADFAERILAIGPDYLSFLPAYTGLTTPPDFDSHAPRQLVLDQMARVRAMDHGGTEVYYKMNKFEDNWRGEEVTLPRNSYDKCIAHQFSTALHANGSFYLCPYFTSEEFRLGSIYENTFEEIWHSEKRRNLVKNMKLDKCPAECCWHPFNVTMHDILAPSPDNHPNFVL